MMNKLIDQMLELYFLGGNLREILQAGKDFKRGNIRPVIGRTKKVYYQKSFGQLFKGW